MGGRHAQDAPPRVVDDPQPAAGAVGNTRQEVVGVVVQLHGLPGGVGDALQLSSGFSAEGRASKDAAGVEAVAGVVLVRDAHVAVRIVADREPFLHQVG